MEPQTQGTQSEQKGNGGSSSEASFGLGGSSSQSSQSSGSSSLGMQSGGGSSAQQQTEGKVAKMIESQTSKLPSDTFLWAAVGAMATSAILQFSGAKDKSRFFGQWVAPLLLFGVYNKMVKQQGHDRMSA
jgi:hypothetical protein